MTTTCDACPLVTLVKRLEGERDRFKLMAEMNFNTVVTQQVACQEALDRLHTKIYQLLDTAKKKGLI